MNEEVRPFARISIALFVMSGVAVLVSYDDALGGMVRKLLVFFAGLIVVLGLLGVALRTGHENRQLFRLIASCVLGWGLSWLLLGWTGLMLAQGWGAGQLLPVSGLIGGSLCGGAFAGFVGSPRGRNRGGWEFVVLGGVASAVFASLVLSLPALVVQGASWHDWLDIIGTMLLVFGPLACLSSLVSYRLFTHLITPRAVTAE